jgi:hypothetical protein
MSSRFNKNPAGSQPLTIWYELDTALRPINNDEVMTVKRGAEAGWESADIFIPEIGPSWVLSDEIVKQSKRDSSKNELTRISRAVGFALGIRAHDLGLMPPALQESFSPAYLLTPREMAAVREGKARGTHLAEAAPDQSFEELFIKSIQESRRADRQPAMAAYIGDAIGIRTVKLVGVRV